MGKERNKERVGRGGGNKEKKEKIEEKRG